MTPWSASQEEALMPSDDDSDFESAGRRAEQQGGNPLFNVQRERVGQSRSWQNGTAVIERVARSSGAC